MRWLPAQDKLLIQMVRIKTMVYPEIAKRFDCTEDEVRARYEALTRSDEPAQSNPLPTSEQVEEIKQALDPIQREFLDLCQNYNAMGDSLRAFSEIVSSALAAEEVERVVQAALDATRKDGESAAQKIARILHSHCVIVMRPQPKTDASQG